MGHGLVDRLFRWLLHPEYLLEGRPEVGIGPGVQKGVGGGVDVAEPRENVVRRRADAVLAEGGDDEAESRKG